MKNWSWSVFLVIATSGLLGGPFLTTSSAIESSQFSRSRRSDDSVACILPPQPSHGSYSIVGKSEIPIPGELVKEFTFLETTCLSNYIINGPNRIACSDGKWSAENVTCTKICKPLVSSSIQYDCSLNGVSVDCEKPMAAGTKAISSCKENYNPVQLPGETIHCAQNGEWEQSFVICTPECGTTPMGSKFAINAYKAHQHQFPWHAAIYDNENSKDPNIPDFICGGTIVCSNKIISAAHCFWDAKENKARGAEAFVVGYGKEFSGWQHKDDKFGKYSDVKELLIHPHYHDIVQSYAQDIAVLVLSNVIEFNRMIKPICINWAEDSHDDNTEAGDIGKVPGWGKITEEGDLSPQLMQLNMPVVSRRNCKRNSPKDFIPFITSDKICAGYGNGSSLCHGDSGGGLIFYDDIKNAFYLKGVVSTGPVHEGLCDSYAYTLFTAVVQFLPWLQEQKAHREPEVFVCTSSQRISLQDKCDGIVDCDDGSDESMDLCTIVENNEPAELKAGSCILPAKPGNGTYKIAGSKETPAAWTPVQEGTVLKYKCNRNLYKRFVLTSTGEVVCTQGQWLPALPECKKPCKPLEAGDGTRLSCKLGRDSSVSCNEPIAPGTDVIITCYPGFRRPDSFFRFLTCGEDSTWNFPLVNCESECGITYTTGNVGDRVEMEYDIKNKYGQEYFRVALSPWSAYIYEKVPDADPVVICSGTLVRIRSNFGADFNAIITALNCFTDEKGGHRDPALFAVGMAKLNESWNYENDKFAFYSDISYIRPILASPKSQQGIGFIQLTKEIPMSYLIRPICLDYHAELHSFAQYNFPALAAADSANLDFTTVEPKLERKICPQQNGEGIFSLVTEKMLFTHYLLGILSLDNNKDLPCRLGSFNATSVHHLFI